MGKCKHHDFRKLLYTLGGNLSMKTFQAGGRSPLLSVKTI